MNTLKIRDLTIGEGRPKILTSIVSKNKEGILEDAKYFNTLPIDVVEWRCDFFDDVFDNEAVLEVLKSLRETLINKPILLTFRTKDEGGEKAIDNDAYKTLNIEACKSGLVDLIDVEIYKDEQMAKDIIKEAHDLNVKVVASNHDFNKTPSKDEIVSRLRHMQDLDADIPKIAVMPTCKKDVLTLLNATEEMYTNYADRPLITMSMGGMGVISRVAGEAFGSSMTFGAAKKASAPGQMGDSDLETVLDLLHKSM